MITGDGNLLEVQASIRYTIARPRVYLFAVNDPEGLLRNAAESVLREAVAGRRMANLLTTDRARFGRLALDRLRQRCGEDELGLRLEGVALHDLHPPQEVVRAYHDVTRAMESRDRQVNMAREQRIKDLANQEGASLQTVRRAEAERYEKVRRARARLNEFLARYRARARLSAAQEWALARAAFIAFGNGKSAEEAGKEYQRRRGEARAAQEALTDFRLYWEQVAGALAGREKVIIDADKVPGRRHLWLVPFAPLPFPMPGMSLPERAPRSRPGARRPAASESNPEP
jgi:regulator of protease activity HflC (stomatin/prohibitin superfamily)